MMEKSHLRRLRLKFPEALAGKSVITLLVPDDFEYMQPELVDELTTKISMHMGGGLFS